MQQTALSPNPGLLAGDDVGPPSWLLFGAEPLRAAVEFASAQWMDSASLPRGDGHAVVLFPGLASDARAMAPLRRMCLRLGYRCLDWGRGFNTGPDGEPERWLGDLAADVASAAGDGPVSLVGWSLGGIYAREVAKALPQPPRQVITIGSPFGGSAAQTRAGFVYRVLNRRPAPSAPALARRLATPPEAPTTSIYSRSDGIVAWQACIQRGASHARVENVEVSGSHCGLGWNPEVLAVVADRLAQPPGRWRPYR